MRPTLSRQDPALPFSAPGQTGDHRLGPGQLSLRRKRRGCDREAKIRSVLHPPLLAQARCDDRVEDGAYDAVRERALGLAEKHRSYRLSVIGYQELRSPARRFK